MFGRWRRQSETSKRDFAIPEGLRVYAVGDIHGCRDELERLLGRIAEDSSGCGLDVRLVFVGDFIDRGPDSKGVIDRLLAGNLPGRSNFLMGNHEEAMVNVLDGNVESLSGWLTYGGIQTLESYGLDRAEIFRLGAELPRRMREIVPADHVQFLRSLEDYVRIGDYLFVHAGIRPGIPVEKQDQFDLRWIRGEFLDDEVTDHGMMVVHGHTISEEPQLRANRIGIDTGCFASGVLTALVLEGAERRFLQS